MLEGAVYLYYFFKMKKSIDQFSRLVMSVYNNKGVYALLLGSGISLPAKVMSGWKVTEDLIKKLAVIQGESINNDAFDWFKSKYGCDAEYSMLLEQLGRKPSEMAGLLRPYFEPSEEDIEFGYKKPTDAHKAIAEMARRGYFKVIITTNFDRLLETALDELGVRYQVICHESEIESRDPLYHHPLTLVKINGDYKDCRFRNTEKELDSYPKELTEYIDSILKNFGVITCGWSATWDKALIRQINSENSHRYSYFYTYVGEESSEIKAITKDSKGESIQIADGDSFFTEMNERLKALEIINCKKMEADAEVATARVKMYIAEPQKLIQYTDLFEDITETLLDEEQGVSYSAETPNATLFERAIAESTNALSVLLPMSIVAVRWAGKMHYEAIVESLSKIANRTINEPSYYYEQSRKLNHMLDTSYLYGVGIACVLYKKYELLDKILKVKFIEYNNLFSPYIIDQDNCWITDSLTWNNTTGYSRLKTPFSSTMAKSLRSCFSIIKKEEHFISLFCVFEKLLAMYYYSLICKTLDFESWPPMGMFCWRPAFLERSYETSYRDFFESFEMEQSNHLAIKSGMFNGSYDVYKESYDVVTGLEKKALTSMY